MRYGSETKINVCHFGDCRDTMRKLIADGVKVQTCVTSPPYFGLRDYGHPGQIGQEATPGEFVDAMVEVFDLVRELLTDDGTLWLNLGDSYATRGGANQTPQSGDIFQRRERGKNVVCHRKRVFDGWDVKPKNLIGIPWRVAFALQDAGWYLRQDIIWSKPNPMPESVRDRCTKAHEYLFLLSKNEKYFFDSDAIREECSLKSHGSPRVNRGDKNAVLGHGGETTGLGKWTAKDMENGRNKRSVWTVATVPYTEAHFAVFPPALIEPCILAGSRPGDTVFDPFFGSGTAGEVAGNLGRNWIGCELNPNYFELQRMRTAQPGLMLGDA